MQGGSTAPPHVAACQPPAGFFVGEFNYIDISSFSNIAWRHAVDVPQRELQENP